MGKRYSQIIGTVIRSRDDDRRIGVVKHVILDTDKGEIVAFWVSFFKDLVILPRDIIKWKENVIIPSRGDLVRIDEVEKVKNIREKKQYVLTKKVFTESGIYLGRVVDYEFDDEFFQIRQLYVKKSFLFIFFVSRYLVDAKSIIEVNEYKVIVKDCVVKDSEVNMSKQFTPV